MKFSHIMGLLAFSSAVANASPAPINTPFNTPGAESLAIMTPTPTMPTETASPVSPLAKRQYGPGGLSPTPINMPWPFSNKPWANKSWLQQRVELELWDLLNKNGPKLLNFMEKLENTFPFLDSVIPDMEPHLTEKMYAHILVGKAVAMIAGTKLTMAMQANFGEIPGQEPWKDEPDYNLYLGCKAKNWPAGACESITGPSRWMHPGMVHTWESGRCASRNPATNKEGCICVTNRGEDQETCRAPPMKRDLETANHNDSKLFDYSCKFLPGPEDMVRVLAFCLKHDLYPTCKEEIPEVFSDTQLWLDLVDWCYDHMLTVGPEEDNCRELFNKPGLEKTGIELMYEYIHGPGIENKIKQVNVEEFVTRKQPEERAEPLTEITDVKKREVQVTMPTLAETYTWCTNNMGQQDCKILVCSPDYENGKWLTYPVCHGYPMDITGLLTVPNMARTWGWQSWKVLESKPFNLDNALKNLPRVMA